MYGAGDVRVEEVADPELEQPTDALVRIVRTCVCGSAASAIAHITSPLARATTMRVEPR
jgi:threonine dehydrogenase-like Zn-dependent dehydrogenase